MPACAEREDRMNHSKGNQKHLTLSQRIEIEKGLNYNRSFAEIARTFEKDPSTISKEVHKYRTAKTRNNDFASIPCASRSNCSACVFVKMKVEQKGSKSCAVYNELGF